MESQFETQLLLLPAEYFQKSWRKFSCRRFLPNPSVNGM